MIKNFSLQIDELSKKKGVSTVKKVDKGA